MIVCIAEKPSVARDIAKIIGATQAKDGYMEGNGYQVTWTFGHLCTLKEPQDYTDKWKYWRLEDLPMVPSSFGIKLINQQSSIRQFHTIEKLVQNCSEVINCGDAGQEGELIQRWVLLKAKCNVPIKRLWISSLTEEAIKEGFSKLVDAQKYENLYKAGSARAIGDWMLGMNATRLFTVKFGRGKATLSIGRVQTPTLSMIVQRHKEIDAFVVDEYWELKTMYRATEFTATIDRLRSKDKAEKGLAYLKQHLFEVTSFEQKEGKEGNPRLFDLTALQVEANRKYSFTAEDTLKGIQNLYEKKLVTYPRVDTTYLSEDIYPKVEGVLREMKPYEKLIAPLLTQPIPKSKAVFDDKKVTDHHAIIPTGVFPQGLPLNEKQIYDLIAKRFIAVFYPECKVSNTTVLGKVGQVEFKATGKQIIELGWREVYHTEKPTESEKKGEEEVVMPHFVEGESGEHVPKIHQGKTSPPKYYTEATLLRAMETAGKQVEDDEMRELLKDNGIGRPSTRANIIETLFRRKYIERKKKNIVPTQTGIDLIDTIQNELLKSPELTGDWERKLRLIEKGEYEFETFKQELIQMVDALTQEVIFNSKRVISIEPVKPVVAEKNVKPREKKEKKSTQPEDYLCPKCKKINLRKGNTAYGCGDFTNCGFKIPFGLLNKKLTEKQIVDLITTGKTSKIKGLEMPGTEKSFDARFVLTKDFGIEIER